MQSIFHITGGLGKHVLFSSVLNSYKKTYPEKEIIVSSAYPDVFEKNPNITESLNLNNHQYFYKHYIYKKNVEIFAQEPYKQTSHILKQRHLIETWCDLIGIEQKSPPSLHISYREMEYTQKAIMQHRSKPILIFQPFGGMENPSSPYCWARDIHPKLAQTIVDLLHPNYNILFICNKSHPSLNNCIRIDDPLPPNILFSLLLFSEKRILIDSCLQHAAHALSLPSLVIWNVTDPAVFGYTTHINICSNIQTNGTRNSYFFDYEIGGLVTECPFPSHADMFDIEKIISTIKQNF